MASIALNLDERAILERGEADPAWWVEQVLRRQPWGLQRKILESVRDHRVTAVRSSHAVGKSFTAACVALWFLYTKPGAIVLTTAPTHRQVRGILWREILRLHRDARLASTRLGGAATEVQLKLAPDWFAWGFTAPEWDPSKFQGFHAQDVLIIVDEAAGVATPVFEGIDSAMSGGAARQLMIGNPTDDSGEFGRAFKLDSVSTFAISAFETPNFTEFGITLDTIRSHREAWKEKVAGRPLPYPSLITPEWVREKWDDWCDGRVEGEGDPRWRARVMAEFPTSSENALFPSDWIDLAMERHGAVDWSGGGTCRFGVDVARFGADTTQVAVHFPGFGVREVIRFPKLDTVDTADEIATLVAHESADGNTATEVRIDADGLGAGVYDQAERLIGERAFEVRSGARAGQPSRFFNSRSEMAWRLREALDPKAEHPIALPNDRELREELRSFRWFLRPDGRVQVESKDELKARLGRSPDRADATIYAVADAIGEAPPPEILI